MAYEKNVELKTDIAEDIIRWCNAHYAQRIAAELIENALKYEPAGGEVFVCLKAEKHKAVFTVQNKNSHVAAEDLPHVFDRFYRIDKSRSTTQGYGLGLAITKEMVEKLNGKITAQSTAEGTVFTVYFS